MQIIVNGRRREVHEGHTVEELLISMGFKPTAVAVWIGDRQVWQREYETLKLSPGDQVRVVKPIAGG
ncbi:MAG: sulfur carrier protein ThiS [Bacillota bacterium]